ncbi:MAG: hypothetical protein AVDCRST_MAG93-5799, partial [uncultured Chloroflexia bacterium]
DPRCHIRLHTAGVGCAAPAHHRLVQPGDRLCPLPQPSYREGPCRYLWHHRGSLHAL